MGFQSTNHGVAICRSTWLAVVIVFTGSAESAPAAPKKGIPAVELSHQHAATCFVGVGDEFPARQLPDLDGTIRQPEDLLGKTTTVVFLWHGDGQMSKTLLADVSPDIIEWAGDSGVAVVGVAVGQNTETTRGQLAPTTEKFPILIDADGSAFARVGEKMLPRVYVLDAEGRIVWFDIEYSESTRRELRQTLQVMTGRLPPTQARKESAAERPNNATVE